VDFGQQSWSCPASSALQQQLPRVERKAGETSDHCTVEPDELEIFSDVDFNQLDQLIDVPALDLIGDENGLARSVPVNR
jgi:hypothetical protein